MALEDLLGDGEEEGEEGGEGGTAGSAGDEGAEAGTPKFKFNFGRQKGPPAPLRAGPPLASSSGREAGTSLVGPPAGSAPPAQTPPAAPAPPESRPPPGASGGQPAAAAAAAVPATPSSSSFWGMGKNIGGLGGWLSKKAEDAGAAAAKAGGARAPRQSKALRAKYEARKDADGRA